MDSRQLGNLLIGLFEGSSFKEVVACGRDERFNKMLQEKVGSDKFNELDNLDPIIWLDALRMLYFHYLDQQNS